MTVEHSLDSGDGQTFSASRRDTLLDLAERCERAKGPDYALNQAIGIAVGQAYYPPAYTASLDAAMTLVPVGYDWTVYHTVASAEYPRGSSAGCAPTDDSVRTADASDTLAATSALALTAAALRARAAQEPDHA